MIKKTDELSKNHRDQDTTEEGGVMLATGTENCPVKSFKMYVSKLNPKMTTSFQRPTKNIREGGPWFDNMVIGEKSLGKMMKDISIDAKLTTIYTNHSIRATTITNLDSAGLEARHIMSISGHRS